MSAPKEFWENFPHLERAVETFSKQPRISLEAKREQSRRNRELSGETLTEAKSEAAPKPNYPWEQYEAARKAVEAFSNQEDISLEEMLAQSKRNKAQLAAMEGPPKPPLPSVTCAAERFVNAMHSRGNLIPFRKRLERLTALLNEA